MDQSVSMKYFVKRQIRHIRQEGLSGLLRKVVILARLLWLFTRRLFTRILAKFVPTLLMLSLSFFIVLFTRLVRPIVLIRFGRLVHPRIGHFAMNTELYLCERDAKINNHAKRCVDIFSINSGKKLCNHQLALMWRRIWILTY